MEVLISTGYLSKVEYTDVPPGSYTAITGRVTVKVGDVKVNDVPVHTLDDIVTKSAPGMVTYEPFTCTIQDVGTNYSAMSAIATGRTLKTWRFTRGPAATGDTTLTFEGYINSISGSDYQQDQVPTFEIQIKPTSSAALGTVS